MKLKNSNCDETQKCIVIKLKTHIVMKLESSNCVETQKLKLRCDKTKKKTQVVTKLKL